LEVDDTHAVVVFDEFSVCEKPTCIALPKSWTGFGSI